MMASGTPREALDLALDFLPPSERFLHLQKQTEGNEYSAVAEPVHDDDAEVSHFLVEHAFAALTRVCRFVVAPWYGPKRVELSREPPADPHSHEEAFGCPVQFGCAANRLVFELIEHPIATADALVARLCRHQLEQRTGAGAPSELEAVIVRALRANLRSPPSMAEIAASINVSERTLRRRLLGAELSYAGLLDQERMHRALAMLGSSDTPMARVAEESGFSDTRSLRRAIKRWTGQTPSQLRRHDE
ncbi:AraC family transcriptional regulator [Piscinibacter aquaticus]|uniref:AraC family transcriptional regulator n=1 Tax=Piscinibacter aquaticus TaxID=392597 RepID=A0A5C6U503_9BURK|nr:AraC family transcriptional regulator [Piscinibacter aquaticus]